MRLIIYSKSDKEKWEKISELIRLIFMRKIISKYRFSLNHKQNIALSFTLFILTEGPRSSLMFEISN